jgi:hypothetical protein
MSAEIQNLAWRDSQFSPSYTDREVEDVVVWLSSGEPHVCGPRCDDLVLTADKLFVCKISGVAWGPQQLRSDFSTGRCTTSANVDDVAGKVVGGSWKPRKNLILLSRQANAAVQHGLVTEEVGQPIRSADGFLNNNDGDDEDQENAEVGKEVPRSRMGKTTLGGVPQMLCEDHDDEEEEEREVYQAQENLQLNVLAPENVVAVSAIKRKINKPSSKTLPKPPKPLPTTPPKPPPKLAPKSPSSEKLDIKKPKRRNVDVTKVNTKSIQSECEATLIKLITHESGVVDAKLTPSASQVFNVAFLKLIRQQNQYQLTLNEIHNLELSVQRMVVEAKAKESSGGRKSLLAVPMVKEAVFSLSIAIWSACLKSPHYLRKGVLRRCNDSFRPIFSGLLYSWGRGIHLPSGVCILPQLHCLERCIIPLKRASSTQRALHSLSHRGLCSLHRIVASYGVDADKAFEEAAYLASELVTIVKRELGD